MYPLQTQVPVFGELTQGELIILAVILAVLVLGVVVLLVRRVRSGGGNEDTGEARQQEQEAREKYRVPLRTHAREMPREGKVAMLALAVAFLVAGWEVYTVAKTGGPSQVLQSTYVQVAIIVAVALPLGMAYERRRRARTEGTITAIIEADPETGVEEQEVEIPIDPRDVEQVADARPHDPAGLDIDTEGLGLDDGETGLVAHEYTANRVFSLTRRPKRIAEDKNLRDDPDLARPLDDKIGYEIPPWATKIGEGEWVFRTKGLKKSLSPNIYADYYWEPPYSMNRERRERLKTDNQMMRETVASKNARIAHQSQQIDELERTVQRLLTSSWDEVMDKLEDLRQFASGNMTVRQTLEEAPNNPFGHGPRQNGQQGHTGQQRDGTGRAPADGQDGGGR